MITTGAKPRLVSLAYDHLGTENDKLTAVACYESGPCWTCLVTSDTASFGDVSRCEDYNPLHEVLQLNIT